MFEPIAHIHTDLPSKFGLPRQSGLVPSLQGKIVFASAFRDPALIRGIGQFSHLWLLWQFNKPGMNATVRPPRLGGNERLGVFATRSPFRPNPIGLSCVRLVGVDYEEPSLVVSGVDLMDGTPILDIKPYLVYADSRPEARSGFAGNAPGARVSVDDPSGLLDILDSEHRMTLLGLLAQDPRPAYQHDPSRVYGMAYARWNVRFRVEGDVLTIVELTPADKSERGD